MPTYDDIVKKWDWGNAGSAIFYPRTSKPVTQGLITIDCESYAHATLPETPIAINDNTTHEKRHRAY